MRQSTRILAPFAVGVAILLAVGCTSIPAAGESETSGTSLPEHGVDRKLESLIHPGVTRIDDAFAKLSPHVNWTYAPEQPFFTLFPRSRTQGPPLSYLRRWSVSADHRHFSLNYSVYSESWLLPACYAGYRPAQSRWLMLDTDERGTIISAIVTDHPLVPATTDPMEWLKIFDQPTRRRLQAAGALPSDDEIMAAVCTEHEQHHATPATQPNS